MKVSGLALALAFILSAPSHADVLLLDAIASAPPNAQDGLLRPRSGASMTQVEQKFGPPNSVKEAVGEPPITRWIYPDYTVYFEHQFVINVVVHR